VLSLCKGASEPSSTVVGVSAVRHHTVPRFLLGHSAVDAGQGPRVCQLDVRTGQPRQVSPRSAEVNKHFYSIDIDDGARSSRSQGATACLGFRPRLSFRHSRS
jgi:hypothetical protein